MAVERNRRWKWKAIGVTINISLSRVFQPKQFGRGEVINTKRQGFFMLYTRESLTALYVFYLFFSFSLFSFLFSFFCYSNCRQPGQWQERIKSVVLAGNRTPTPIFCVCCVVLGFAYYDMRFPARVRPCPCLFFCVCCVGICILRYAISNTCTIPG